MFYSDNPEMDALRHDAYQQMKAEQLPHCEHCGEPIYDDYYNINGEIICDECMSTFRVYV